MVDWNCCVYGNHQLADGAGSAAPQLASRVGARALSYAGRVSREDPIQGELQEEIMRVIWANQEPLGVDGVRKGLPRGRRGAYTTVQTVLNRLAERGLLRREKVGIAIRYSAEVSEAEYVAGSLSRSLDGASKQARQAALASLVGGLGRGELREIRALAREVDKQRGRGR